MNKKLIFTIISVIYIIILLLGASVVKLGEVSSTPNSDKLLHFLGFFVLSLILIFTLDSYKIKNKYITSFIVALIIGIIIEIIQLFIPERSFSLWDLAVDIAGTLVALVLRWSFIKH